MGIGSLTDWLHDLPVFVQTILGIFLTAILAAVGWTTKMIFSRPKLRGEIMGIRTQPQPGGPGEELLMGQLMIGVKIANKRKNPTTVRDWELEVKHKGKKYSAKRIDYHGQWFRNQNIGQVTLLAEFCRLNPLTMGIHKDGVLFFEVSGICEALEMDSRVALKAVDGTGRVHRVASKYLPEE